MPLFSSRSCSVRHSFTSRHLIPFPCSFSTSLFYIAVTQSFPVGGYCLLRCRQDSNGFGTLSDLRQFLLSLAYTPFFFPSRFLSSSASSSHVVNGLSFPFYTHSSLGTHQQRLVILVHCQTFLTPASGQTHMYLTAWDW